MREKCSEVGLVAAAGPDVVPALRVLLVEDEPALARAIAASALCRHDVTLAEHGAAALRLVDDATRPFELVVSDVHMPGMNGIDLHRAIAARGSALASRFVLISGSFASPAHQDYLDQNGLTLLTKPFAAADLEREIARLLRQPSAGARAI